MRAQEIRPAKVQYQQSAVPNGVPACIMLAATAAEIAAAVVACLGHLSEATGIERRSDIDGQYGAVDADYVVRQANVGSSHLHQQALGVHLEGTKCEEGVDV